MESSCLAVSFCIEIYAFEIVLVRVLIPCSPEIGVFEFFLLELQQYSSERGMLDILPLAGFLLCCRLPLFSPQ
jgi:hypothetical protein